MDSRKIGVGDIVRVKGKEWWEENEMDNWKFGKVVFGGVRIYGAHQLAVGKLMIVRQITADGCYLTEHMGEEANALFPFEMIEEDLRVVSRSEMYKMRDMFGDIIREKLSAEYSAKFDFFKNKACHMLRSQWVRISDGSMPENLGLLKEEDEKGGTMSKRVMVLCTDGEMHMARRYRVDAATEWEWFPKMPGRPLYWLLLPEEPETKGLSCSGRKADSWRTKLTAWLLKIGLIR